MAQLQSGMRITPARSRGYQSGSTTLSITASTFGTVNIVFPTAFAATPNFAASIVTGSGTFVKATIFTTALSAAGATVRVDLNASATASTTISWIAVEQ